MQFVLFSAGDHAVQIHPLWSEYLDPCRAAAGVDQPWSIGTEMRQLTLHKPEVRCSETFAQILRDDSKRRRYVLDANVQVLNYKFSGSGT